VIQDVVIDGQKYEVNTTPSSCNGHYPFATVFGVRESPASGVIANVLRELGKKPVTRVLVEVDRSEIQHIVKSLGWKFSRSRAWQNLWELYGRNRQ